MSRFARAALVPLVIPLLTTTACAPSEDGSEAGDDVGAITEREGARIQQSARAFAEAARAGDFDRLASMYAEDAVLMPPGAPTVHGRPAIREFLSSMPAFERFELNPEDIEGRGDLAYVRGNFLMTVLAVPGDTASAVTERGKFLEVRERQSDGSWLLVVDIWNSNGADGGSGAGD